MIVEHLAGMHERLYSNYSEFEEAYMRLEEQLRTPLADRVRAAERKAREEGREEGRE
jgi:hypothetical protein